MLNINWELLFNISRTLSSRRNHSFVVLLTVCVTLGACGSRPETGALAVSHDPAPGAKEHTLLIATTRDREATPDTYFNGERTKKGVDFAKATISVPPNHKPGNIEWPSSPPGNPNKDFVVRSASYIDSEKQFLNDLNRQLEKLPPKDRNVSLFIHGYNTKFAEGLYRFTQVTHDADMPEVPVLFTWASSGHLSDYIYDLNSAAIARDSLERTLVLLSKSRARNISILAHSMGNFLLMEMAARIDPKNKRLLEGKLRLVVMAAPDIDIDLFKANLKRIGVSGPPYVVVLSHDDRALQLSQTLAGGKERLGAFSNDDELAKLGAVVFDLTDIQGNDGTNHGKFAQLAQYAPQIENLIKNTQLKDLNIDNSSTAEAGVSNLGNLVSGATSSFLNLPLRLTTRQNQLIQGN